MRRGLFVNCVRGHTVPSILISSRQEKWHMLLTYAKIYSASFIANTVTVFFVKKKKVEQPNRTCFTLEYPLDQVRNKESSGNKDLQLIYKHLIQTWNSLCYTTIYYIMLFIVLYSILISRHISLYFVTIMSNAHVCNRDRTRLWIPLR